MFVDGRSRADVIMGELNAYLEATGNAQYLNPTYLEFYVAHLLMTSTGHLPEVRLMRHSGLLNLFYCVMKAEVEGEVAECGCYAGLSALQMATTMKMFDPSFTGGGLHLFDSFEGLSEPVPEDYGVGDDKLKIDFKVEESQVRAVFNSQGYPNTKIYKGWIPYRFHEVEDRVFKFVHLDVDLYGPTKDGLKFFWPRLSSGGVIITDDYDWAGPRKAMDDFAEANELVLFKSMFNQAYFIKS